MNSDVHRFYRKFDDEQAPIRLYHEAPPCFQCFFAAWTPNEQAENVYYSMIEKTPSDISDRNSWQENLAFPTFLDWLIFYKESIE